ncbi:hypothetical protein B0T25DRAFT_95335 [Lasiosphaeria hispida]|uniref:Ubiquitin-like protease family profile domain-containing protein n=1 Tax=Lasiosphaeria hispida TaxID=260671 RepID=A0AAJ0HQA3_9PEZI|nr:hypothetical protein B0T25DRAFT_95335 [Lasiosphaeria hispida]
MAAQSFLDSVGFRPINTLNSAPSTSTRKRDSSHPPHTGGPTAKRQRPADFPDRHFPPPDMELDIERVSRTQYASQESGKPSFSDGVPEYRKVESNAGPKRPSRRGRRSTESQSPCLAPVKAPGFYHKDLELEQDRITECDELASGSETRMRRPQQLGSSSARRLDTSGSINRFGDGADHQFRPRRPVTARIKRPAGNNAGIEDDELGQPHSKPSIFNKKSVRRSAKAPTSSVSRKGDLAPTERNIRLPVKSAVCDPIHRYLDQSVNPVESEEGKLYLQPQGVSQDLRAFNSDGRPADEYPWLKIAVIVKTLHWHPDSPIIKISQPADPSRMIGGKLVIVFYSKEDASLAAEWAKNQLGRNVYEDDSAKLDQTNEKAARQIADYLSNISPAKAPAHEVARFQLMEREGAQCPEIFKASRASRASTAAAVPSTAPLRSRMALRGQTSPLTRSPRTQDEVAEIPLSTKQRPIRSTRSRGAPVVTQAPSPQPTVSRWSETEENLGWDKQWQIPLTYQRTTVDKDDIPRLDEGQCLNDNLIGFGLQYLFQMQAARDPSLSKRVYMHNSFFYEKLRSDRSYGGKINYAGVRSWTAKVDLLSYDYIIVPVNEHFHWWVAIICNPGRLDPDAPRSWAGGDYGLPNGYSDDSMKLANPQGASPDLEVTDVVEKTPSLSPQPSTATGFQRPPTDSPQDMVTSDIWPNIGNDEVVELIADDDTIDKNIPFKFGKSTKRGRKSLGPPPRRYDPEDPRIITMDSLGQSHSPAVGALKTYLVAEFKDKRGMIIDELPMTLGMRAKNIPEQNNFCDCGVYLLGYMQEFLKNPDQFVHTLLQNERPKWDVNPMKLREIWREHIFAEQTTYQRRCLEEKMKKRAAASSKGRLVEPTAETKADAHSNTPRPSVPLTRSAEANIHTKAEGEAKAISAHAQPTKPRLATASPRLEGLPAFGSSFVVHHPQKPTEEGHPAVSPLPKSPTTPRPRRHQREGSSDEVMLVPASGHVVRPSIEKKPEGGGGFLHLLPESSPAQRSPTSPPRNGSIEIQEVFELASKRYGSEARSARRQGRGVITSLSLSPGVPSRVSNRGTLHPSVDRVERAVLVRGSSHVDLTDD